jgi:hypothetical protein
VLLHFLTQEQNDIIFPFKESEYFKFFFFKFNFKKYFRNGKIFWVCPILEFKYDYIKEKFGNQILEIIENFDKKGDKPFIKIDSQKQDFLDTIFTVFSLDPTENKFISWDNNINKGDELEFAFVLNLWIRYCLHILETKKKKGDVVFLEKLSVGKFQSTLKNHFVKWKGIIRLNYKFCGDKKNFNLLKNYIVINGAHAEYGDDFFTSFENKEEKIIETLDIIQCKNTKKKISKSIEKEEFTKVFGGTIKQKLYERDKDITDLSRLIFVKPNCKAKIVKFEGKNIEYITGENFLPLTLFLTINEILKEKVSEIKTPTPLPTSKNDDTIFNQKPMKQQSILQFFTKKKK